MANYRTFQTNTGPRKFWFFVSMDDHAQATDLGKSMMNHREIGQYRVAKRYVRGHGNTFDLWIDRLQPGMIPPRGMR